MCDGHRSAATFEGLSFALAFFHVLGKKFPLVPLSLLSSRWSWCVGLYQFFILVEETCFGIQQLWGGCGWEDSPEKVDVNFMCGSQGQFWRLGAFWIADGSKGSGAMMSCTGFNLYQPSWTRLPLYRSGLFCLIGVKNEGQVDMHQCSNNTFSLPMRDKIW